MEPTQGSGQLGQGAGREGAGREGEPRQAGQAGQHESKSKRTAREIAHQVESQMQLWQRAQWQRGGGGAPVTDQELEAAETVTLTRTEMFDLLLAGFAVADWALEDRAEAEPAVPRWCTVCGKRGEDLRRADLHAICCPVGLWLHVVEVMEKMTGGGLLAGLAAHAASEARTSEEAAVRQEIKSAQAAERARRWDSAMRSGECEGEE